ncbi:hypothetical protein [Tumebacillus flagellatus]|uniref:Uncharacterized protein n=1 Tax=Tumebacillus flagellatus TaxID=1157490 RepID=A0A074LLX1_9BACL|nr:hypothetical protein [Tumebacillus flagellatus]KEO80898.1 hypothetical protein EL26_23765 [Tumebacillus flagellatus]
MVKKGILLFVLSTIVFVAGMSTWSAIENRSGVLQVEERGPGPLGIVKVAQELGPGPLGALKVLHEDVRG